ncbi:MAG TPA: sigma-70 family RNA polymerase sigma factor [Rubricoccaceae bacterium]
MRDLAHLAAALPFSVDDTDAAAAAFAAAKAGDSAARRHVDLWAYIWTLRYVARKFLTERVGEPSDVDAVETRALDGVRQAWDRVEDAARFPSYVSVVCKNAVLTHRARRRIMVEADEEELEPVIDDERLDHDGPIVRRDVAAAIAGLPPAVRSVAEMRFLDGTSYEDIAEATGHPLPTVRTYLSKAVARLREAPHLRAHFFDDVLPPGALAG